jgi:hydrogenase expression/formation protein HypC
MKIIERQTPSRAVAESLGVKRIVCTDFVPEVKTGNFVLVHVGYAMQIIEQWEASERIKFLEEILAGEGAIGDGVSK